MRTLYLSEMIDDSEGVEGLVDKNLYMNGGSW